MLTFLGFVMVITFMVLIMTQRLSALVALIVIPVVFGLFGGFAGDIGPMMLQGITKLAPTGVMLMFAILYFSLMIDSGLFDPPVRFILRMVKGDPLKIAVGTAALALIVSLDGDGATTYMICVAAMLPLYSRIGMNPRIMAGLIVLAGGIMNMTPWGGPTARAASALHVDPSEIFVPMAASAGIDILNPGGSDADAPGRVVGVRDAVDIVDEAPARGRRASPAPSRAPRRSRAACSASRRSSGPRATS